MGQLPDQTINRLPIYLRCLTQARTVGISVINSLQLGQMAGTNAAQVRKDLSYLGELGRRGIGYDVDSLSAHVADVLGLTQVRRIAVLGLGRLGGALAAYPGFADRGFEVVAVFDEDPSKVGMVDRRAGVPGGLTVRSVENLEADLQELGVEIVILATPPGPAQALADRVAAAGVRAILNFATVRLELPDDVRVRPVDLSVELQVLSFHLARTS